MELVPDYFSVSKITMQPTRNRVISACLDRMIHPGEAIRIRVKIVLPSLMTIVSCLDRFMAASVCVYIPSATKNAIYNEKNEIEES